MSEQGALKKFIDQQNGGPLLRSKPVQHLVSRQRDTTIKSSDFGKKNLLSAGPFHNTEQVKEGGRFSVQRNPFTEEPVVVHPRFSAGQVNLTAPFPKSRWEPTQNNMRIEMGKKMAEMQKIDHMSTKSEPSMSNAKNMIIKKARLPRVQSVKHSDAEKSSFRALPQSTRSNNLMWNNMQVVNPHDQKYQTGQRTKDLRLEALNKKREAYKVKAEERKDREEQVLKAALQARRQ
jgi:hypothetical protein